MRGALDVFGAVPAVPGLIPARAGSTQQRASRASLCGAHPRPCGEHLQASSPWRNILGSSPPVRGAPLWVLRSSTGSGLIPARAGSTVSRAGGEPGSGAHPRPCGEHLTISLSGETMLGSSPPVRGALSEVLLPTRGGGLIPARAGSTLLGVPSFGVVWAHPRPCGEHVLILSCSGTVAGSSPPVRGAP